MEKKIIAELEQVIDARKTRDKWSAVDRQLRNELQSLWTTSTEEVSSQTEVEPRKALSQAMWKTLSDLQSAVMAGDQSNQTKPVMPLKKALLLKERLSSLKMEIEEKQKVPGFNTQNWKQTLSQFIEHMPRLDQISILREQMNAGVIKLQEAEEGVQAAENKLRDSVEDLKKNQPARFEKDKQDFELLLDKGPKIYWEARVNRSKKYIEGLNDLREKLEEVQNSNEEAPERQEELQECIEQMLEEVCEESAKVQQIIQKHSALFGEQQVVEWTHEWEGYIAALSEEMDSPFSRVRNLMSNLQSMRESVDTQLEDMSKLIKPRTKTFEEIGKIKSNYKKLCREIDNSEPKDPHVPSTSMALKKEPIKFRKTLQVQEQKLQELQLKIGEVGLQFSEVLLQEMCIKNPFERLINADFSNTTSLKIQQEAMEDTLVSMRKQRQFIRNNLETYRNALEKIPQYDLLSIKPAPTEKSYEEKLMMIEGGWQVLQGETDRLRTESENSIAQIKNKRDGLQSERGGALTLIAIPFKWLALNNELQNSKECLQLLEAEKNHLDDEHTLNSIENTQVGKAISALRSDQSIPMFAMAPITKSKGVMQAATSALSSPKENITKEERILKRWINELEITKQLGEMATKSSATKKITLKSPLNTEASPSSSLTNDGPLADSTPPQKYGRLRGAKVKSASSSISGATSSVSANQRQVPSVESTLYKLQELTIRTREEKAFELPSHIQSIKKMLNPDNSTNLVKAEELGMISTRCLYESIKQCLEAMKVMVTPTGNKRQESNVNAQKLIEEIRAKRNELQGRLDGMNPNQLDQKDMATLRDDVAKFYVGKFDEGIKAFHKKVNVQDYMSDPNAPRLEGYIKPNMLVHAAGIVLGSYYYDHTTLPHMKDIAKKPEVSEEMIQQKTAAILIGFNNMAFYYFGGMNRKREPQYQTRNQAVISARIYWDKASDNKQKDGVDVVILSTSGGEKSQQDYLKTANEHFPSMETNFDIIVAPLVDDSALLPALIEEKKFDGATTPSYQRRLNDILADRFMPRVFDAEYKSFCYLDKLIDQYKKSKTNVKCVANIVTRYVPCLGCAEAFDALTKRHPTLKATLETNSKLLHKSEMENWEPSTELEYHGRAPMKPDANGIFHVNVPHLYTVLRIRREACIEIANKLNISADQIELKLPEQLKNFNGNVCLRKNGLVYVAVEQGPRRPDSKTIIVRGTPEALKMKNPEADRVEYTLQQQKAKRGR